MERVTYATCRACVALTSKYAPVKMISVCPIIALRVICVSDIGR